MDPQLQSGPSPNPPSSPSKPQPLAELSPNKTSPAKPTAKFQASSAEMRSDENATHPPGRNRSDQPATQAYVSPSDTLLSPTTKKLSQIKGRRFAAAKPQSLALFAKALGKQAPRGNDTLAGAGAGVDAGQVEK